MFFVLSTDRDQDFYMNLLPYDGEVSGTAISLDNQTISFTIKDGVKAGVRYTVKRNLP
jgi:outer membrane protein assembly factor BamA